MEKLGVHDLKVGQMAEIKTFEEGFRGSWFRCKIWDINLETNRIKPEYYNFPDEEITWTKIYEEELMVRPQYPVIYQKSEMPAVNSISEVCVVINGAWKVGDFVDWHKDGCYWSARIIKILSDDKFKIELLIAPLGEGGIYEAFCKDLRPSLEWSPSKGWTVHTVEGHTSCSAHLIFPSHQA